MTGSGLTRAGSPPESTPRRPVRSRTRTAAAWLGRYRSGTWLAQAYAAAVLLVALVLNLLPSRDALRIVLDSSTNLVNLGEHPLAVLIASAFVVSPAWGLWVVPVLLGVYGAAQRWLGPAPTLAVAVLGHVGATLFVGALLGSGLAHGRVDGSAARAEDVGVSYGLAAVAGLLAARIPGGRRRWYVLLLLAYCLAPAAFAPDFTDVGHVAAALVGLSVALVVVRAGAAAADANPDG
jgi:hypothetical protein